LSLIEKSGLNKGDFTDGRRLCLVAAVCVAAIKLVWLALRNVTAEWRRPAYHWRGAMNQFAILYEDRSTKVMV
jgi:hypothetical protein